MDSPAERDWFSRWRWIVVATVLGLLAIELLLMGPAQGKEINRSLFFEVLAAVIPNFIAGLVGAVVLYVTIRDDEKTHYVRAMRSLRSAVGALLADNKLTPEDVQSLMVRFVPAVSGLYFKTEQPPVRATDAAVNYQKRQCSSCRRPSPVEGGRCTLCHDILASWQEEERVP
jgi:hypothetical protein